MRVSLERKPILRVSLERKPFMRVSLERKPIMRVSLEGKPILRVTLERKPRLHLYVLHWGRNLDPTESLGTKHLPGQIKKLIREKNIK